LEQPVTGRRLSSRESTILHLAADGKTDKQIAAELQLSVGTVRTYWSRIRSKMNSATRAQAVGIFVKGQSPRPCGPYLCSALTSVCDGLGLPYWETDESGAVTSLVGLRGERFLKALRGAEPKAGDRWAESLDPEPRRAVMQALAVATSCNPGHARVVRLSLPGTRVSGTLVLFPLLEKGRVCGVAFVSD
jgi:DNA-binding CsgD family transcriptional regulator